VRGQSSMMFRKCKTGRQGDTCSQANFLDSYIYIVIIGQCYTIDRVWRGKIRPWVKNGGVRSRDPTLETTPSPLNRHCSTCAPIMLLARPVNCFSQTCGVCLLYVPLRRGSRVSKRTRGKSWEGRDQTKLL